MSAHTKGPWTCTPRFQDKVDVIHAEPKKPGAASLTVARVVVRDSWLHEQTANARLIAASPDLLEALRDIVASADAGQAAILNRLVIQAKHAIARATGEQP